MEQKFWDNLCDLLDLPTDLREDKKDPAATLRAVTEIIASRDSDHWRAAFAECDCCCTIVQDTKEALADPHFRARGLFDRRVTDGGATGPAIPVPVAPQFRGNDTDVPYPKLGEANDLLDGK